MMQEGLLWFDDDPKRPVAEKIARAVARHLQKYSIAANVCYVNPATVGEGDVAGVSVRHAAHILPCYFYVGVEHDKRHSPLA